VEPHRPERLLLWEADQIDHVEDVTGFTDVKIEALLAHRSQLRSTMQIGDPASGPERDAFRRRVLERLAEHGARAGIGAGEGFKLIDRL
jgi:LmbE family N-acetylglucosaminyl deacetylase